MEPVYLLIKYNLTEFMFELRLNTVQLFKVWIWLRISWRDYILCTSFFSSLPWLLLMVPKKTTQAVWHHLVLSWCTMVSQVKKRFVQDSKEIDYDKQHHTPHCWLPDNVMYCLTRLTRTTKFLLMKNVHIYIYIYVEPTRLFFSGLSKVVV